MTVEPNELISAQVVLRSATGKVADGSTAITAATLAEYAPSSQTVSQATATLRSLGFEVGPLGGTSVSITGTAATFERVFGTKVTRTAEGGRAPAACESSAPYTLLRRLIPASLSDVVVDVTFTPPPDFGPTNFGP